MRQPPHFRIKIKSFLGFCYHFLSNAGSGDGGAHQRNAADVVFSADGDDGVDGADVVFTETRASDIAAVSVDFGLPTWRPCR